MRTSIKRRSWGEFSLLNNIKNKRRSRIKQDLFLNLMLLARHSEHSFTFARIAHEIAETWTYDWNNFAQYTDVFIDYLFSQARKSRSNLSKCFEHPKCSRSRRSRVSLLKIFELEPGEAGRVCQKFFYQSKMKKKNTGCYHLSCVFAGFLAIIYLNAETNENVILYLKKILRSQTSEDGDFLTLILPHTTK